MSLAPEYKKLTGVAHFMAAATYWPVDFPEHGKRRHFVRKSPQVAD